MAIQMTRAEYEAKYGTTPPVVNKPAPVKMTRAEYEQKYGSSPDTAKKPVTEQKKGFLKDLGGDIKETGVGLLDTVKNRWQKQKDISKATFSGEQTKAEGLFQTGGNIIGGLGEGAFNLLVGGGKAILTEGGEKKVGGVITKGIEKVAGSEKVQKGIEKYEQFSPRTKRNLGAGFDIGTAIPVLGAGRVVAKGAEKVLPTVTRMAKGAIEKTADTLIKKPAKFGLSQATGLQKETLETIARQPKSFGIGAGKEAIPDRIEFGESVKGTLQSRLDDLSDIGKEYDTIRKSTDIVKIPRNEVINTLDTKWGIKMRDGRLTVDKESTSRLSQSELNKLESFLNTYADTDELSSNAFLNARHSLDEIAKYEGGIGKFDNLERVARDLRSLYDGKGKGQIKGLRELDETYRAEASTLRDLQKRLLDPKTGELKDSAFSTLANLTSPSKKSVLEKLQKIRPEILDEVRVLKALEDIEAVKGRVVGSYTRAIVLGTTATGFVATQDPRWALGAMLAYPPIAINIIKAYGTARNINRGVINAISNKIRKGKTLNPAEKEIVEKAIDSTDNTLLLPAPGQTSATRAVQSADAIPVIPRGRNIEYIGAKEVVGEYTPAKGGLTNPTRKQVADANEARLVEEYTPERDLPIIPFGKSKKTTKQPDIIYIKPSRKIREIITAKDPETAKAIFSVERVVSAVKDKAKKVVDDYKKMTPRDKQGGYINIGEMLGGGKAVSKADDIYKETGDLTLKTLKKLEGKSTVSKQFISDLTNSGDLKQAEKDILREVLESFDDNKKINVKEFADRVKIELLPLEARGGAGYTDFVDSTQAKKAFKKGQEVYGMEEMMGEFNYVKINDIEDIGMYDSYSIGKKPFVSKYENITLPEDIRGNVENYFERVYESPIKTSGGDVHFGGESDRYFAHSRIEDMSGSSKTKMKSGDKQGTRRVIEIQSDLMQKGRLENEFDPKKASGHRGRDTFDSRITREKEVAKLEPYRNNWYERIIKEEVKLASKDGKKKLQFPTGETAMKIEGLGDNSRWYTREQPSGLTKDKLKIGLEIRSDVGGAGNPDATEWIVTDVLGDGKFKAVSKESIENSGVELSDFIAKSKKVENKTGRLSEEDIAIDMINKNVEQFDISGKVDKENPIYKFYEKDVQKYLKNKYNAKIVKDENGVEWIEVDIKDEYAKMPIEAYGIMAPIMSQDDEK